jgi:hypothetical protein
MMLTKKARDINPMTRAERREINLANDTLEKLILEFIAYKNLHIHEDKGELLIDDVVDDCFSELNEKWKRFCHAYKTNTTRKYKFDTTVFRKRVEEHIATHHRLCRNNYVLKECEARGLFPSYNDVDKLYHPDFCYESIDFKEIRNNIKTSLMNLLEIKSLKIKRSYPETIEELTIKQFIFFCDLCLRFRMNEINIDEFKVLLVMKLLNIKSTASYERLLDKSQKDASMMKVVDYIHQNIHQLTESLDGFFTTEDDGKVKQSVPKTYFLKNMLPEIAVKGKLFKRKYYGPADALQNCTFYEYRTVHDLFVEYSDKKNDAILLKMLAVLYRPKKRFLWFKKLMPKYNGDPRTPITADSNQQYIDDRAAMFAKLPVAYRYAMLLFIDNVENNLRYGTIEVSGQTLELSIMYQSDTDYVSTGPDIGYTGILFAVAESGIFGNISQTDSANLYDVIVRLYQLKKDSNDHKASMEKLYNK